MFILAKVCMDCTIVNILPREKRFSVIKDTVKRCVSGCEPVECTHFSLACFAKRVYFNNSILINDHANTLELVC